MILITGGIGAGKSVVSRILRLLSFPVFDCDFEAKKIMVTSPEIKAFIRNEIGPDIINEGGGIERGKLREAIFNDVSKREGLNRIVHKEVRTAIARFKEREGDDCFVESAIPHTGNLLKLATGIWIVEASEEERIRRVKMRSGLSEKEIKTIIKTQHIETEACRNFGIPVKTIYNDARSDVMKEIFVCLAKKD